VTSEAIEVRPYRDGDEDSVLDLFNLVFAEGHSARDRAHWEWEFLRNPAGNQVVLGIASDGRVVAQYACLPAVVHLRGERVMVGQGIDSVVHPDWRRGLKREGAFLKVARYYFEHYGIPEVNAFGYGLPNEKAYRIGVRMLGYVPIAAPLPTLARNLFDRDELADAADLGAPREALHVVPVDRFGADADGLWQRLAAEHPMAIVRDAKYLNWRFLDCPSVDYRAFAVVDGSRWRATFVLRENWTGPPILAITELFLARDDAAALGTILRHTVAYARAHGQQRVETWIPRSHPHFARALDLGFITEPSPFNLCIKIYRAGLSPEFAAAHWWYTIGDSDVF
jgi:hypothetical protein